MAILAFSKGDLKPFPGLGHGRKVSQEIKSGLGLGAKLDKKGLATNPGGPGGPGGPRLRAAKSTPTLQVKETANSSSDLLRTADPLSAESSKTFSSSMSASSTSRSTTPSLGTKKSNRTLNMEQWVDPLGPGSSPYDVIPRPGQPQPRRRLRNASSRPRLRTGPPSTRTPSVYSLTPSGLQVPLPPARPGMGPRGLSAPHIPQHAPESTLLDTYPAGQRSLSAQGPFPDSSSPLMGGLPTEGLAQSETEGLGLMNAGPDAYNRSLDASNKYVDAADKSLDASNKSVDAANKSLDAPNRSLDTANRSLDAANKSLNTPNRSLEATATSRSADSSRVPSRDKSLVGAPFRVDFDAPRTSTASSEFASTNPAPSFVTAASPVAPQPQPPRVPAKSPSMQSQPATPTTRIQAPMQPAASSPANITMQAPPVVQPMATATPSASVPRAQPNLLKELPSTGFAAAAAAPATVSPLAHEWPADEQDIHRRYTAAFATSDSALHVRWALETFRYAERRHDGAPVSTPGAPWTFNEHPALQPLFALAVDAILRVAHMRKKPEAVLPQDTLSVAMYLRGDLGRSGCSPEKWPLDERRSFRDFEAAANTGLHAAWFRIGRAYEEHGDTDRAVHAYSIGIERGADPSCLYRLGMAHLLGQLAVTLDGNLAFELLRRSAERATTDAPQAPYILGLLLAGEFEVAKRGLGPSESQVQASILNAVKAGLATLCENPMDHIKTAYSLVERSATLLFGPAQLRLGQAFEFGNLACTFNPSLSLHHYLRASGNGQADADMALSKWFLCGSEGHFEKSEQLAVVYARRAAARGLHSASFALGYFYEVGIIDNTPNLALAASWYRQAIAQGNPDSQERLEAILATESDDAPAASTTYQPHASVAAECLGSSLLADWADTAVN